MCNLKSKILFIHVILSCGIISVHSANASISDFPYHVSVEYNDAHSCSGVFIAERWILTVGSCVHRNGLTNLTVRVATDISSTGGTQLEVRSVAIHDDFNSATYDNDVALLQLSTPLVFGEGKLPIVLPSTDYVIPVETVTTVTGWTKSASGAVTSQLTAISTPIVNQTVCSESLPIFKELLDSMICAGYMTSGYDVCQGDSGSPLVYEDQLIGTLTYGLGCSDPTYPAVYTRITSFVPWILSKTGVLF